MSRQQPMADLAANPATYLQVRRILDAPREMVFRAWTEPEMLKRWFRVSEDYSTPIAEVDLRVGGRYRLGMRPPDGSPALIVGGMYREISPPERLVFTWRWETAAADEPESLVTVEFNERSGVTEVVLTHEGFVSNARRDEHAQGWQGCLDRLDQALKQVA